MRAIRLTYLLAAVLAMILIAGSTSSTSATPLKQATDPASVVTAFEGMIGNAQDIDAALALYADNAVEKIIPAPQGTSGTYTGKTEIRQGLEYAVTHKVQHTLNGTPQVNGNTVTLSAMVTNDVFQRLGVAPVEFQIVAVVADGKMTSYTATILPAEGRRVAAAAAAAQGAQSSGAGQPVLPRTGGAPDKPGSWWLIAGASTLALGLLLSQRRRQSRRTTSR